MMRGLFSSSRLFATKLFDGRRRSNQFSQCNRAFSLIPMVIEHSSRGERAYDIFSRSVSSASTDPSQTTPHTLSSLSFSSSNLKTPPSPSTCTIMIHQPSGGYSDQAKDIAIHTKQIVRVWDSLNELYRKHTGQTIDIIQKNMDRDYFMTPEEAKKFGIIDEVIDQRPMALVSDAVANEGKDKGSD